MRRTGIPVGGGGGLLEWEGLYSFNLPLRGALLEGGGLFEGGGLLEVLRCLERRPLTDFVSVPRTLLHVDRCCRPSSS